MDTVFFVILILRQLLLSCAIRKLTILKGNGIARSHDNKSRTLSPMHRDDE
jgi:hypothetical protein